VSTGPGGRLPVTPPTATGRVDTGARLVPTDVPREALICAYQPASHLTTSVPLSGSKRLPAAGLPALAENLAYLPGRAPGERRPCTTIGYARPATYLVRLGYRGATVWVATQVDPNACVDTTNGRFRSPTYVGDQVDAAFRTGAWAPPEPRPESAGAACSPPRAGRLGQERVLVPDTPVAVDICTGSTAGRVTARDGVDDLAAAFNRLPTRSSDNGCSAPRWIISPSYLVVFHYAQGPPVLVRVDTWCDPPIDNSSLQSTDAAPVVPLLKQLHRQNARG
jgi:hypothetical protein